MALPDSKRPAISIVIPTFNRAALLGEAIESLLAQERKADEIIVVDDGSTDDTPQVLSRFGSAITAITQSNQGRSAARNVGLRAAQGDLITFLDSDDSLPPESIARRARVLESQPEIGVVYSDVLLVNQEGERITLFSKAYPVTKPSGRIFSELAQRNFIVLSSVMFRRLPPGEMCYFDEDLDTSEDHDFWLRLSDKVQFQYIDEALVHYRLPESTEFSPKYWGLPGEAHMTHHLEAKAAELKVQRRVFSMQAFARLTPREKARVYCSHGVKQAMARNMRAARQFFLKAIKASPPYPVGYGLLLFSMLGRGAFEAIILWRRQLIRGWG